VGAEAARNALRAVGGRRIPSGRYRVVLGPQAVTDILTHIVLPSLNLGSLYASSSCFLGKFTQQVVDPRLSLYDHGALPGRMGSKGITCEGLPTGRTDLIRGGAMVGTLANYYESRRILRDPHAAEKLGVAPAGCPGAIVPRNGFRFLGGGGRSHFRTPGISSTNVFVESSQPVGRDELLRQVGEGVYVGRIWYTYPVNGLTAGDFTCTVIADSYLIRGGAIAEPLLPNVVRIDDNVKRLFNSVIAVGREQRGVVVWAADEVVHAPEMAVADVPITSIGGFLGGGA
jgi:predicted Zn-dependent protease